MTIALSDTPAKMAPSVKFPINVVPKVNVYSMAVLWNANVCLDTKVMDMTVKISMSANNPQFVIRCMAGVIAQIPQGHTIVTARITTLDGIVKLISREDTVLISMFIMISRLLVLICKSIAYLSTTPRAEGINFCPSQDV
jgi:hypothetical protein